MIGVAAGTVAMSELNVGNPVLLRWLTDLFTVLTLIYYISCIVPAGLTNACKCFSGSGRWLLDWFWYKGCTFVFLLICAGPVQRYEVGSFVGKYISDIKIDIICSEYYQITHIGHKKRIYMKTLLWSKTNYKISIILLIIQGQFYGRI